MSFPPLKILQTYLQISSDFQAVKEVDIDPLRRIPGIQVHNSGEGLWLSGHDNPSD